MGRNEMGQCRNEFWWNRIGMGERLWSWGEKEGNGVVWSERERIAMVGNGMGGLERSWGGSEKEWEKDYGVSTRRKGNGGSMH